MIAFYNDLTKLCDRIERDWLKYNYASEDFYKVVWEASEQTDLSPLGQVANQLRLLEHPMVRVNQELSTFSDLYFQLYNNGRFMIEILNWHGGHVNVHDHDFSGVQFQVRGDALNVVYDFDNGVQNDGALRFGDLRVREARLWKEGGRSIVRAGDVDPHCVFHLGQPTTSILIRTLPTTRLGSQSNYFPTLAAHYKVNTAIQRKKLTGLNLLLTENPREFRELFRGFLETQSLAESFFMMLKLGPRLFTPNYVDIIDGYAQRGEKEGKVVSSVIYNNGIDFFKTRANRYGSDSQDERLAMFAVAATVNPSNMDKLSGDLRAAGIDLRLNQHVRSFTAKLSGADKAQAERYLKIWGLKGAEQASA